MESSQPNNRGGRREGAGRKPGSVSRLSKEAREKALETGMLPHEILLSMARGDLQTEQYLDSASGEVMTRLVTVDLEARRDAAKAAAPYYAPKMATVELVKTVSDDELDAIIAELASQAGVGVGAAGEGETDGDEGSEDDVDTPNTNSRRRSVFD